MTRLVVDGYNIVHAWPELAATLRGDSLEEARRRLLVRLAEYRATTGNEVLVVFDARFRARGTPDREMVEGVEVRYGSAQESADHVIERLMYEASRRGRVLEMVLATDDRLQRGLVAGMGVPTLSSRALRAEVERAEKERGGEVVRRAERSSAAARVENRISPEARRRLEEIRRGGGSGAAGGGGPEVGP
ncbi:MAG: NYN domain-containing protein [Candidatus Dormiibacterota bacterium]